MKKIKYVLLGISLSIFIFFVANLIFGEYYKNTMFTVDEEITFNVIINNDDKKDLIIIEDIFKQNAFESFSIVVHNNSKSNIPEYNFFTTNYYQEKIITYQQIDFTSPFELISGDGILFDPLNKQPIIINNLDFENMSENAIVVLYNFTTENVSKVISELKANLANNDLLTEISFEEVVNYDDNSQPNIYLLKEHIYIFLVVVIISLLIFKDINSDFKEISLMKLEGNSAFAIYFNYVISNIITVIVTLIVSLTLISLFKYNVSIKFVSLYYKLLVFHLLTCMLLLFVFTSLGYMIVHKTKIHNSIKGYNQLETSIIGLSLLKVLVLIILSLILTNYIKTLPQSITGLLNYQKSIEKYHGLFLINSSLNAEVNQVLEIEKIKDTLSKEHNGFSTSCLPEGDSALSSDNITFPIKDYSSIYYIVDSNKNQITIAPNSIINQYDEDTFQHYGFDSFEIIEDDLKTNEFIYCTRNRVSAFYEKLYYKDYKVIKIEVANIYEHDLKPNFILFYAENKNQANNIIDDIYEKLGEKNQLLVESMEEDLKNSYNVDRQVVIEAIINLIVITVVLLVLNGELINNFINYDKEENMYLHLIGKSKFYMLKKYLLANLAIILSIFIVKVILYIKYNIIINPSLIIMFILIELISMIYYQRQIDYKKLKGL